MTFYEAIEPLRMLWWRFIWATMDALTPGIILLTRLIRRISQP